jgi:hypothetical protein
MGIYTREIDNAEIQSMGYDVGERLYLKMNVNYIPGIVEEIQYQIRIGKEANANFHLKGGINLDYGASMIVTLLKPSLRDV